jgi:UDP-N-acetylglucosamine--N-acetylmuramyl-(pentapeptide) pyrophosphoryl-undecaprenol N-acetylglucosamine transferase
MGEKHILVICGSQGSRAVFEAIVEQFGKDNPYEWIIALGKLNVDMKSDFQTMGNMQALDWISQEDIAHLLENTDLAITRGSATTLAEIDVFGVKKIIIPLPYSADNHQYYNAREYEKR